ncbi:hypothetical protein [Nostocoides jenkinsii]|uniref:Uncharacterized protein n=1 Tax=Nostocoides jenkinsii Ben 74 TaxID=1193518 RepID=A0A077MDM8_9MICO|nr:hypothetical protein [Tetrasphaera jenkinsii]CCI53007.1 hypothetical protein BN13_280004 [Tetrasphaera jenkinsii Ben 74]
MTDADVDLMIFHPDGPHGAPLSIEEENALDAPGWMGFRSNIESQVQSTLEEWVPPGDGIEFGYGTAKDGMHIAKHLDNDFRIVGPTRGCAEWGYRRNLRITEPRSTREIVHAGIKQLAADIAAIRSYAPPAT